LSTFKNNLFHHDKTLQEIKGKIKMVGRWCNARRRLSRVVDVAYERKGTHTEAEILIQECPVGYRPGRWASLKNRGCSRGSVSIHPDETIVFSHPIAI